MMLKKKYVLMVSLLFTLQSLLGGINIGAIIDNTILRKGLTSLWMVISPATGFFHKSTDIYINFQHWHFLIIGNLLIDALIYTPLFFLVKKFSNGKKREYFWIGMLSIFSLFFILALLF